MVSLRFAADGFWSTEQTLAFWRRVNGCDSGDGATANLDDRDRSDQSTVTAVSSHCPAGRDVMLYRVNGGGHRMPGRFPDSYLARAVNLLFTGKADLIECVPDRELRSATARHPLPSVLRLRYYVNVPRRGAVWSRRRVMSRDSYACIYCGVAVGDNHRGRTLTRADFTVDHLIPRSRGGGNTWGNTACACRWCNHRRGGHQT